MPMFLFPPALLPKIHLIKEYSKKNGTAAKKTVKLLPASQASAWWEQEVDWTDYTHRGRQACGC